MFSSGMIACHPENVALAREAALRREAMRKRIARALQPFAGVDEARRMARHLVAVMQGISIQARDGVKPRELRQIVDDVVSGVAARFPRDRRRH